MTDITLEQLARELLEAECKKPCSYDESHIPTRHAHAAIKAALRLSAGADWVLVPRVLTDEMCQAGHKAQWDAKPDGILGGEVTISLNAIYRTIFAAQIAAAPRHEPGEG